MIESANELIGGAYSYTVPSKYFPRYKTTGGGDLPYPDYDPNRYNFTYKVDLQAPHGKKISYLSTPSFSDYIESNDRALVSVYEPVTDTPPTKDIKIFYKTTEMMLTPNLFVEKSRKFKDEVAVSASFAPSFDNNSGSNEINVVSDEYPEKIPVNGTDFHFVFIIDRSGSMQGENIIVARKALKLFVQSLPMDCKISIISFGSRWELHKQFGNITSESGTFNYTDGNMA